MTMRILQLMPYGQRQAIYAGLAGEERVFFADKLRELRRLFDAMPMAYQTEDQPDPMVTLHYFRGGADWFIIEKDPDTDGQGQVQAFGLADLFHDGGELGYISIPELVSVGAELDLYFTPQPLSQVRAAREARR